MEFKLSSTILLLIAVTVQTTVAGDYDGGNTHFNFGGGSGGGGGFAGYDGGGHTDGHPIETIDLGSYVGKHHIPPKVIKITKTVAYKVPVPYPVKVPHGVPYPVPVPKPYPVHVPKYIKIKEQVPVYIPAPHGEQHNHGGGGGGGGGYEHFNHAGGDGNAGFDGGHAAFDVGGHHHGGFGSADAGGFGNQHQGGGHVGFEGTDAGNDGHHHEGFGGVAGFNGGYGGGGSENGHEGYANSGAGDGNYGQYAGETAYHQSEDGGAGGGSADGGGQYYNNQQQQHQEEGHGYNDEEQHHGQFSGKYLIYTNPKSGVSAYQTADNKGNHGYHFEQNLSSSSYTPAAAGNDGDKNGNYQSSRTHQTQSHHTITTNQNYADEADAAGAGGNNYQPEREMVTGSGEYQH